MVASSRGLNLRDCEDLRHLMAVIDYNPSGIDCSAIYVLFMISLDDARFSSSSCSTTTTISGVSINNEVIGELYESPLNIYLLTDSPPD